MSEYEDHELDKVDKAYPALVEEQSNKEYGKDGLI